MMSGSRSAAGTDAPKWVKVREVDTRFETMLASLSARLRVEDMSISFLGREGTLALGEVREARAVGEEDVGSVSVQSFPSLRL